MTVRISGKPTQAVGIEVLAVPVYCTPDGPVVGPTGAANPDDLAPAVAAGLRRLRTFHGAVGQVTVVPVADVEALVVAVGVGLAGDCTIERLRAASSALGSYLRGHPSVATSLALARSGDLSSALKAVVEGFSWGRFRFRGGDAEAELTLLVGPTHDDSSASLGEAVAVAGQAASAVTWVRTAVETPPSELPPSAFAERVREQAEAAGVGCQVWSSEQIRDAGFGGTLGVGSGSANPPVVVELTYAGDGRSPTWGLAGKGVTFDSGGINLKRDAGEISWMKSDMAGAASVVAAICAAASLRAARPVRAVLPLAENLPGHRALLPGDVVRHPDGSTTEVLDTDCEGRLVLADAVSYLVARRVAAVIDVGTLTDGGAVGHLLWGCWGTSPELIEALLAAGSAAGDPGWHLPLRSEYLALFDSPVADRANRARDVPDTGTMAATFLSAFAGAVPWVHIDNGSTAYLDADLSPWGRGATGSPTLALLELLLRSP